MNHLPIVAAFFALALLLASRAYARDVLLRTAFGVLIVVGVAGGVAKLSGDPAEDGVRGKPVLGGRVRHTEVRPSATAADAIFIEPPRVRRPDTTQTAPPGSVRD